MFAPTAPNGLQQTTSYKVVLPFYIYAALSLLVATVLLFLNTDIVRHHYFHPHTLAITHVLALGWGTMIIFGASHQLLPVLIEGKLDSDMLAYVTFVASSVGIPFLVTGFYIFHTGWVLHAGAVLINIAVVAFLINVLSSIYESKRHDVHAWFMAAAALWLFSTTFFGLLLVFNFTATLLPDNSIAYLSIHAHLGIVGWFLLLVLGVASRLIPMFLISKYTNNRMLWVIFAAVNAGLISFLFLRLSGANTTFYYVSLALVLTAVACFVVYCYKAYKVRIRKNVDEQMKMSLLAVAMLVLPVVAVVVVLLLMPQGKYASIALLYGFFIFFGWITALIFGMTFKTLPFIVWNKVYHNSAHGGKTPAPKELFSEKIFNWMVVVYLTGFVLFSLGIITHNNILLKTGAAALLIAALLYVYNVAHTLQHKPAKP